MGKVYGLGIIGTGVIFDSHAIGLEPLKGRVRLVAAADLDPKRLKRASDRYFVPHTYTDHRALLGRDDIDIVTIATPPSTHEVLVLEALQAGKYVICEKPLAHTLESADRIIAEMANYPGKVAVGFQQRFMPSVQKAVWLRDHGFLGDWQYGLFRRLSHFSGSSASGTGWWGKWDVSGGGVVMTQFIHELDLMIHLFGPVVEVMAMADTLHQDIESEDTFGATVRFANGAIATCCSTINAPSSLVMYEAVGAQASVHMPTWGLRCADGHRLREMNTALSEAFPESNTPKASGGAAGRFKAKVLWKLQGAGTAKKVMRKAAGLVGIRPAPPEPSNHTRFFQAILDAIDRGEPLPVSPKSARPAMELCTAIYASALSGQPVLFPLDSSNACYKGVTIDGYRQRHSYAGQANLA
ncbi:MAG: Gfo/Idh/MocA family oxidoreductase [Verrucomicrobiota bacterium]|nr:Gfo/Idh/MocA family oxidoreductase [Verrucomicrobiota bacterium]MDD8051930.1 Gfo/Idh/MocA family oxidoreductase [Verrucomicrobiota bacterium]